MPTISPPKIDLIFSLNTPGSVMVKTYIRPDADSSDGSWTNESGGTTLFSSIDESAENDSDYIKSSDHPDGDVCKIRLSDFSSDIGPPMEVSYRYKKLGSNGLSLTTRLLQGSTVIASWVDSDVDTGFVTATQTLTTDEFDSISDFTNLFLEFQADPGGVGNLTAELTFLDGSPVGTTLIYDVTDGTDMGNYTASTAGFTQQCVRVRHASLDNFWIDFRPDVSSSRREVVVWNGECDPINTTVASGHTRNLPAYTLVIKENGSIIHTENVPRHYWGQRWRWQSAARSVIRTASDVFSDNFLPPMSSAAGRISGYSGIIVPPVPAAVGTYNTFMMPDSVIETTTTSASAIAGATTLSLTSSSSNFTGWHSKLLIALSDGSTMFAMVTSFDANPITIDRPLEKSVVNGASIKSADQKLACNLAIDGGGERAQIGMVTEWQGDWLLRGTSTSLTAMIQQAEMWGGDLNWFMMWDKETGKPIDWSQDATRYVAHSYSNAYTGYWVAKGLINGFLWDNAESHSYAMFYLPWVLTEDPYYIEAQQAMVAWYIGWAITDRESVFPGLPGGTRRVCSFRGETRSLGWGVRNLALVWKMSPTSAPDWLHGQSLYSQYSDDYAYVIDYFCRTPGHGAEANVFATFRLFGNAYYLQAFEQAYALFGMGLATYFGMPTSTAPDWSVLLDFFFGMFDGLLNGTSGWNHQITVPLGIEYTNTSDSYYIDLNSMTTWTQFYNACIADIPNFKYSSAASPANQQGQPGSSGVVQSLGNASQLLAACAIAKSCGISAAPACKTWLDTFVDYNWPIEGIPFFAKCGFDGT